MSSISVDKPVVTLIDVFTVEPKRQQQLVDILAKATEETMQDFPGFVSANIHNCLDGTHVANYAQWRSEDDYRAMLGNAEAQTHMKAAAALARFEPALYRVVYVDERGD